MFSFLKKNVSKVLIALGELAVGVLLLIRPVGFTAGVIVGVGIVLTLMGAMEAIRYFQSEPVTGAKEQRLLRGLVYLSVGICCIANYEWFIAAFPVLTMLYGVVIFFSGLYKLQLTADLWRMKAGNVFWTGLSAAVALVFAGIILLNPFATVAALWIFVGVTLIAEAVLDVVDLVFLKKGTAK